MGVFLHGEAGTFTGARAAAGVSARPTVQYSDDGRGVPRGYVPRRVDKCPVAAYGAAANSPVARS